MVPITPEQIQSVGTMSATAALIDVWGGVHRLADDIVLGRTFEAPALAIIDSSISRRHARIWRTEEGWRVHDLGSTNRTTVDGHVAVQPIPIATGQQLRVGLIAFYFLADASGIVTPPPSTLTGRTARASLAALYRDGELLTADVVPTAPPELPPVVIELHQPTGGGAGVVAIEGKCLELTLPQYELIVRLVERMIARAHDDPNTRGFIASSELARHLSLEATRPDEDNIRQLVRRVRAACTRAGVRDLIESRYGLGYRLAVTPMLR
jgi:hypothetical protein